MTYKILVLTAFFFLLNLRVNAQTYSNAQTQEADSTLHKELTLLGGFILDQEFKKITPHINALPNHIKAEHKDMFDAFKNIANNTTLSYKEVTLLIDLFNSKSRISEDDFFTLMDLSLFNPEVSVDTFNADYLNYALYKCVSLINIRDFNESNILFKHIQDYANSFDIREQDRAVITYRSNEIKILLSPINENFRNNLPAIYEENLKISTSINDTNMLIAAHLDYVNAQIAYRTNLEELRSILEQTSELNKHSNNDLRLNQRIALYTLQVLIYQNTNTKEDNNRILNVFKKLRKDSNTLYKLNVDKLYLVFLTQHTSHPDIINRALKNLDQQSISTYCKQIIEDGEQVMNNNSLADLMKLCAQALFRFGKYEESSRYSLKSMVKLRDFYSNHLSNLIGEQKAFEMEVNKNLEISEIENQKMFYRYLTILLLALSLFIGLSLFIIRYKNKQLKKSNQYNVLLLQEIHHRVKNNFQISSSLLELKYRNSKSNEVKTILNDWKTRVKSMIQIHETLYQNEFLKVNIKDFVESLVHNTYEIFKEDIALKLKLNSNNNDYLLDIDTAINLGLILNELITNSFKYGSVNNILELHVDIEYTKHMSKITFSDTGLGLSNGIDSAYSGFGLKLIKNLIKQLQGSLTYDYKNGSCFTLHFRDENQRILKE